jgi:hypothetical protein
MLRARVVSEGIRLADPGVVAGLYTPEEVQDFDVKPFPAQPAQAQQAPVEAEVVPPSEPQPDVDAEKKAKAAKVRACILAIKNAGIAEDKRKAWMSDQLGKTVESSKDLTLDELDTLIGRAHSMTRQSGDDDGAS